MGGGSFLLGQSELEMGGNERGDQPLGTVVAEEKREGGEKEKQRNRQRSRAREREEDGR